jgi:membrane-associated protease RseP (regulator of RpoE activity)
VEVPDVKNKKSVIYPLGALLIVAAFWGILAMVQRPRPGEAAQGQSSGGTSNQGFNAAFQKAGSSPKTATDDARTWWGAKVRPRTIEVEDDEPPVQAAEVTELRPGSPGARAGLRVGDAIVGINLQPLTSARQVDDAVAAVSPGGKLSLQILRAGEPVELTVARGGPSSGGGLAPTPQTSSPSAVAGGATQSARTGVSINGREISPQEVQQLRMTYGYVAPPGQYWYDSRSGLYGVMGYEAAGFMQPGHDFGPLPAHASNGNTGVFINGRQINMAEAMYCQRLFGAVYQGRWWLDGRTGNLGAEGNPMPIANVYIALQQQQRSAQGGGYSWHSKITGASGGSDGKCSYVSIPGSGSVMTGNCD